MDDFPSASPHEPHPGSDEELLHALDTIGHLSVLCFDSGLPEAPKTTRKLDEIGADELLAIRAALDRGDKNIAPRFRLAVGVLTELRRLKR
jgi:hypothetical protein